ncbi:Aldehyde dehydrogenase (NAD) family protein [Moritella viscosa]|nr:Aldehyde dehydrogenase (NAD) family protein [Moritella viscosa]
MPTLISYDAHTRNALGSVEITTAEQIPALISESQKTQKKMGNVIIIRTTKTCGKSLPATGTYAK